MLCILIVLLLNMLKSKRKLAVDFGEDCGLRIFSARMNFYGQIAEMKKTGTDDRVPARFETNVYINLRLHGQLQFVHSIERYTCIYTRKRPTIPLSCSASTDNSSALVLT